jgi:hypothetical protein
MELARRVFVALVCAIAISSLATDLWILEARGRSRSNLKSGGLTPSGDRAAARLGCGVPGVAFQADPHDVVLAFGCVPRPWA